MAAPRSLKDYDRWLRLLSGLILITLLGSVGTSYVAFNQINQARNQLTQGQQRLHEARQAPQQLLELQQRLMDTEQELRFLEQGVSAAEYVPTLLKQMEKMAQEVKLKIISVRPVIKQASPSSTEGAEKKGTQTPPKPYEEQLIQVSVKGKFWNLMSLLKRLQSFPKILAVQKMQIQSKQTPEQTGNPDLEVMLEVKAFIFRQSANRQSAVGENPQSEIRNPKPETGNGQ